jgi:DNA ligase-associated metallophosphoesterase
MSHHFMPTDAHQVLDLQGQRLYLLPARAIYWPAQEALLLADPHLGKAAHFRRHGVPVSAEVMHRDLATLSTLVAQWQPQQLIFLGDLFHSHHNQEWDHFCQWMSQYPGQGRLVRGNHDILARAHYEAASLDLIEGFLDLGPFRLIHELPPDGPASADQPYCLAGHVHPGVLLRGAGRQQLRLPCFHFGATGGLLPAFGQFTGLAMIQPRSEDQVFVIAEGQVMAVHAPTK